MDKDQGRAATPVSLKTLAQYLGLAPGTVSKVLNNANGAESISQLTKDRIHAAAREMQYRPNFHAQSLRRKRTYMVGVIVPEMGDPDEGVLIAGIEGHLRQRNYLLLTGVHRNSAEMLASYASLFQSRGVEGVITVDTNFAHNLPIANVAVMVPKNWRDGIRSNTAPAWGASQWTSIQSRNFLERLGEAATEKLLARIEGDGDRLPASYS
jgi:hypothetical protein